MSPEPFTVVISATPKANEKVSATVTALTPGRVRDVAGKGLDHNARESLSSFAQDFLGLKKAQAWIHAKRVIEAIRDGLYLADWRLPS